MSTHFTCRDFIAKVTLRAAMISPPTPVSQAFTPT
jgi:hypothetical protein